MASISPRARRVLVALLERALWRGEVDEVAGCANGPGLIAGLRARGLSIGCELIDVFDRDDKKVTCGRYHLNESSRSKAITLLHEVDP